MNRLITLGVILLGSQTASSAFKTIGDCPTPANFPIGIALTTKFFESYSGDLVVPAVLVAFPRKSSDVAKIANWAVLSSYRLRAVGGRHNFSPFILSPDDAGVRCPKTILLDTTKHFTSMVIVEEDSTARTAKVSVESGVILTDLLTFLENKGYGFFASPAVGQISVGGMLAVGAHGTGVPGSSQDKTVPGQVFGTLSNMILEMTVIAYDENTKSYKEKVVSRTDEDSKGFLVHLGRTFVSSVILRVGRNQKLRTRSNFVINRREAFQSSGENSLSALIKKYGRVDLIAFTNSDNFWAMYWHEQDACPLGSRPVSTPYNYLFMNYVPHFASYILRQANIKLPSIGEISGPVGYIGSSTGTKLTLSRDYWGWSKNHLVFVTNQTPHFCITGYAFLTHIEKVHQVLQKIDNIYTKLEKEFGSDHNYPISSLEYRVTGIDDPADNGLAGATFPSISGGRQSSVHPGFNVVIWMDIASFYGVPRRGEFLYRLQDDIYRNIDKNLAIVRPEWSKEWGYAKDGTGPFKNFTLMNEIFPQTFEDGWDEAINIFNKNDPEKIFSNSFLDKVLIPAR